MTCCTLLGKKVIGSSSPDMNSMMKYLARIIPRIDCSCKAHVPTRKFSKANINRASRQLVANSKPDRNVAGGRTG